MKSTPPIAVASTTDATAATAATAPPRRAAGQGYLPPSLIERDEVRTDRTLRAFLSALAFYARGLKDTCYPSVARLAHDLGCCPGHVRRQIRKARALGLIAVVSVAWNACHRVFKLLWKPDLGVDPRDRTGGRALPERPGTAPYPGAPGRRVRRAPVAVQGSSNEEEKNAGGVVCPQEGHTPPATEAEAAADVDPRSPAEIWAEIRGKQAPPAPPPAPKPPAAPLNNHGKLADVVDTAALARAAAELAAHKAARLAAAAGPAVPSAPAPEATAGPVAPVGWLGQLWNRLRE